MEWIRHKREIPAGVDADQEISRNLIYNHQLREFNDVLLFWRTFAAQFKVLLRVARNSVCLNVCLSRSTNKLRYSSALSLANVHFI